VRATVSAVLGVTVAVTAVWVTCRAASGAGPVVSRLHAPAGWHVEVFAEGIDNARFLRFTPAGDLLVSQPRSGEVLALEPDRDGDGRSDGRHVVIDGLNRPHGMDLQDGWLYVGETDAVGRVRFDPKTGEASGAFERVVTGLPGGGNHWTRTVRFGPDGWMYVSIGSSCNVCKEDDPRRATITRYRPDGSGEEIFATGLRNSVGFDWRPADGEIYATDNGRDMLGDDFPPCELNRIQKGGFYGWPIANGDRVPDPDFGAGQEKRIAASIPPVHGFRAHNAPLGIVFLRGESIPAEYRGAAIVALHGSWNRTRKDGYKVVSLHWKEDGTIEERDFLTGFLGATDDEVVGRPVDAAEGPDGAVYVSDDDAGAVYRVAWGAKGAGASASAAPAEVPGAGAATAAIGPAGAGSVRRGKALWTRHDCALCHDPARATPGMVTRPLAGLSRKYTAQSLSAYLAAPNPPMPAFDLSASDRGDLAAFLLATHP
jgi:glucose/arabinose dehydrogenase